MRKTLLPRPTETGKRRKPAFLVFSWVVGNRLLTVPSRSDEWGRLNRIEAARRVAESGFLTRKEGS